MCEVEKKKGEKGSWGRCKVGVSNGIQWESFDGEILCATNL